jgi:hypothetical protein
MATGTPYWGKLPPPSINRTNSTRRTANDDLVRDPFAADTNAKAERLSGQSFSARPNRHSIQTNASIPSTVASHESSSVRGGGLAPRPRSYQQPAGEAPYDKDHQEKRRQREARNREFYDETPPPAAPDAPRPPPPVSYKQYGNGVTSNYAAPTRSRSTRKSDGPILPSPDEDNDYFGKVGRDEVSRRASKGKGVDRRGGFEAISPISPEGKRRKVWAEARSPLQRLESTLDSITKEEKRARVEEAELLVKEGNADRGGERLNQNSVRFRNRPVAKAPDPLTKETQRRTDAGVTRNPSTKPKDQLQRSGTVERNRDDARQERERERDDARREVNHSLESPQVPVPSRGKSVRERSAIPLAVGAGAAGAIAGGLSQSVSNKLKKEPPGDPWFNRRVQAEKTYQQVTPRRLSVSDSQQSRAPVPNHPQIEDKELPSLPKEAGAPAGPNNYPDLDSDGDSDILPVRRGGSRKIEQLTGEKSAVQASKTNPASQAYGERTKAEPNTTHTTEKHHELHHISDLLHHRHENVTGQTVYTHSKRLDEWKKGGVVMLDGPLLDLDAVEQTEAEKDRAWWEAGNKGKRTRGSTTKERKAVAYDGEFDDSNGMYLKISSNIVYEACLYEKHNPGMLHKRRMSQSPHRQNEEAIAINRSRGKASLTSRLNPLIISEMADLTLSHLI